MQQAYSSTAWQRMVLLTMCCRLLLMGSFSSWAFSSMAWLQQRSALTKGIIRCLHHGA